MLFSRSFLLAALAAPFVALAQATTGPNPFTLTQAFTATAGQTVEITWNPTTQGTVSLVLRKGSSSDLDTLETIASGIPNSGSYSWSVPTSAIRGTDYALEIVSDSNTSETNYSAYFTLESNNVAAPSTTATSRASTSTLLTPSAFPSAPGLTIVTTPYTPTNGITTTHSSTTGAASSSAQQTTSEQPGLQATAAPTSTDNAAPRATAMVGLLGAVALGALAL